MVIFDEKKNNNGEIQGILYMNGMDMLYLISKYGRKKLSEIMAQDFLEEFVKKEGEIARAYSETEKLLLLVQSHYFGIEFTDIDTIFKEFIDNLISENILYNKSRLSSMKLEELDKKLCEILRDSTKIKDNDPATLYELYSLNFAKSVCQLINRHKELFDRLQETNYPYIREQIELLDSELIFMGVEVHTNLI